MSALPNPTSPPVASPVEADPAADPMRWIALADAARLLSRDAGHLRRLCRDQLEAQQLACNRDGGWFVARRFDQRLAPGRAGQAHQLPQEFDRCSKSQKDKALARRACVMAYRRARQTWRGPQSQWMSRLVAQLRQQYANIRISGTSLRRWHRDYRGDGDLMKLTDTRGGNTRGDADPAAWDYFKSIYLDQRQPTKKSCWRRTQEKAQAEGWRWLTYSAFTRKVDDHVLPETQARYRDPALYPYLYPHLPFHPIVQDRPLTDEVLPCRCD